MRTLQPSNVMILGIAILLLGGILLTVRFYLDELDKIAAEKSPYYLHCPYMGRPFPPQPYWEATLPLTYIGIISCCVGVIVLSIACTTQKTSIRK